MDGRYELADQEWDAIKDCLPRRKRRGRPPRDARQIANRVVLILHSGAPWRDMPGRYGPWETIYRRLREWEEHGVIERMLRSLQGRLNGEDVIDLDLWCIDGTSIRAARAAAGERKGGHRIAGRPGARTISRRFRHQAPPPDRWDGPPLAATFLAMVHMAMICCYFRRLF